MTTLKEDVPILLMAALDARSNGRIGCTLLPPIGRRRPPRKLSAYAVENWGVAEPGAVRAGGPAGCAQPLIVLATSAAVARAARWSSTVVRPAPMVLTDRCVAPASCHCRI